MQFIEFLLLILVHFYPKCFFRKIGEALTSLSTSKSTLLPHFFLNGKTISAYTGSTVSFTAISCKTSTEAHIVYPLVIVHFYPICFLETLFQLTLL